jgi:hypothetical protein
MATAGKCRPRLGAHTRDVDEAHCVRLVIHWMGGAGAPLRADAVFDGAARALACAVVALRTCTTEGLHRALMYIHSAALFLRVPDEEALVERVAASLWSASAAELGAAFGPLLVLQ